MSLQKSLDDIDFQIIDMLQNNPMLTHSEIAKALDRSQPAIGARIKKLTELGFLTTTIGVDFQKVPEIMLARVDMQTIKAEEIMELASYCPFVINALKTSGEHNISLYMAASDLKFLDNVLDRHFRNKPYVKSLKVNRIVDVGKKFILPMDVKAASLAEAGIDPCSIHPQCRQARALAKVRAPEDIVAALENPIPLKEK